MLTLTLQSVDYAQNKSKATLVAEKGPEALLDPALLSSTKKTTFSSAGAELKGRERKRAREEAGVKEVVDGDDSDDDEADEVEEQEDGDETREGKKLKMDNGKEEPQEEEEEEGE
jgi:hypothetical protein